VQKDVFTIVIFPGATSSPKKIQLSRKWVKGVLISALVVTLGLLGSTFYLSHQYLKYQESESELASLRREQPEPLECSLCETPIEGAPASSGLLLWTRGEDIRYDEPPLCASCSTTLMVTAYARWYLEEEGDE